MDKLSKEAERQIMSALEKAVDLTNSGTHPNDAITKVAESYSFSPPIVQRMVEAYNVSKTLAHMKNASGSTRADNFPLADAVSVLEKMYPANVLSTAEKIAAETVPFDYKKKTKNFNKPKYEKMKLPECKKATAYQRDPESIAADLIYDANTTKRAADNATQEARIKFFEVTALAKEAAAYFKQVTHIPFSEIETRICGLHGDLGKKAMDMIYSFGNLKEKRASDTSQRQVMINESQKPYGVITKLIWQAGVFHELNEKSASLYVKAEKAWAASGLEGEKQASTEEAPLLSSLFDENFNTASHSSANGSPMDKAALEGIGGIGDLKNNMESLATTGMNVLGLAPTDPESARRKAMSDVLDPTHEASINAIKTKAILNDFISNDPVLSNHDPKEVMHAYNQLAELAPNVTTQPTIMRGMLRRMLQSENVIEPHEADQVTKIDMTLDKRRGMDLGGILGGK